jgi:hypothetical protein
LMTEAFAIMRANNGFRTDSAEGGPHELPVQGARR